LCPNETACVNPDIPPPPTHHPPPPSFSPPSSLFFPYYSPQLHPAPSKIPTPTYLENLHVENLQYLSDPGSTTNQEWVPLRLVSSPTSSSSPSPVVILLHSTGTSKDTLAQQQADFAKRGYLAATIDCRYHGERSVSPYSYQQALVAAWRGETPEHPFLLDNIWDLQRLLDVLEQTITSSPPTSNEVAVEADMKRVGVTGVSLGGMHAWLLAAADKRIAAAAPMIGVQNFKWAVDNEAYQPRVDSISEVFKAAVVEDVHDKNMPTREIVAAVWDKLLPGMLEKYDSPMSLPTIAPRPFMAINGELDGRCPLPGVELAFQQARKKYREMGVEENLELFVEPGVGHQCTGMMWQKASEFLDKHLLM